MFFIKEVDPEQVIIKAGIAVSPSFRHHQPYAGSVPNEPITQPVVGETNQIFSRLFRVSPTRARSELPTQVSPAIRCFENRILRSGDETGLFANHLDAHQIGANAATSATTPRGITSRHFPCPGFTTVFGLQDGASTASDIPNVFIYKVDIIERCGTAATEARRRTATTSTGRTARTFAQPLGGRISISTFSHVLPPSDVFNMSPARLQQPYRSGYPRNRHPAACLQCRRRGGISSSRRTVQSASDTERKEKRSASPINTPKRLIIVLTMTFSFFY